MNDRDDTIRRLAHALWEARGRPEGSSEVDWLAAEREVTGNYSGPRDAARGPRVERGLGSANAPTEDLKQDGLTNPHDGRGPLRATDDLACDKVPKDPAASAKR